MHNRSYFFGSGLFSSTISSLTNRRAGPHRGTDVDQSSSSAASDSNDPGDDVMSVTELSKAVTTMVQQMKTLQDHIMRAPATAAAPSPRPDQRDVATAVGELRAMRQSVLPSRTPMPHSGKSMMDHLRGSVSARLHTPGFAAGIDDDSNDDDDASDTGSAQHVTGRRAAGTGSDAAADGPIAQRMLDRILKHHRSAYAFVLSVDFNNTRNMHEARRTAQAIDTFLRQGVTADFEGMEILVRNLAGLRKSDELRDPSILEEFEWAPPEDFVPRDIFRAVVKGAQRRAKYSRTTKPKPTGSNNGAGSDKKGPAKGK